MRRSWHRPRPVGLAPTREQMARLSAWIDHLEVNIDLAQATLRLPIVELPALPGEAVSREPARAADFGVGAQVEPVSAVPVSVLPLRGAYARRAAQK